MQIDFFITVWEAFRVPEGREQEVLNKLRTRQITNGSQFFKYLIHNELEDDENPMILDTQEQLSPWEAGGRPTIEVYEEGKRNLLPGKEELYYDNMHWVMDEGTKISEDFVVDKSMTEPNAGEAAYYYVKKGMTQGQLYQVTKFFDTEELRVMPLDLKTSMIFLLEYVENHRFEEFGRNKMSADDIVEELLTQKD